MILKCPKPGCNVRRRDTDGDRFCHLDGEMLVEVRLHICCGWDATSNFCPKCGAKVEEPS